MHLKDTPWYTFLATKYILPKIYTQKRVRAQAHMRPLHTLVRVSVYVRVCVSGMSYYKQVYLIVLSSLYCVPRPHLLYIWH